ncbi:Enkurin domain-containing protein 1 [Entophlyctis sp. JEL0112]|nr:Enkurin domain-containing protein 1 [Entophlyctis sp. JEL0112]
MKLLPEEERVETLNFLKENQKKLLAELSNFGLVVEATKTKNRKMELEKQLSKIEEAIGVFSRRKVFVNAED